MKLKSLFLSLAFIMSSSCSLHVYHHGKNKCDRKEKCSKEKEKCDKDKCPLKNKEGSAEKKA